MKLTIEFLLALALALVNVCWCATYSSLDCGDSSSSKNIDLSNPKYPPRECVYKINAYSDLVCQLRIEFSYTLAQPSLANHYNSVQCDKDYFQAGDLRLCGTESSQHIYLPFNRTAGVKSVDLLVAIANRAGADNNLPNPRWSMTVTQLECPKGAAIRSVLPITPLFGSSTTKDGFFVAPPGCLQYFPHSTGSVTSFNFNRGRGVYPGELNYAICFRRTEYTKALILKYKSFHLGTNESCRRSDSDYIMIPQTNIEESGKRAVHFCGDSLRGREVISSNPGPLIILFNSDGRNRNASGFEFNYDVV